MTPAIALAGKPNVGKSTVFNALTGLNQHTGNWPGKTVETAHGYYEDADGKMELVDLPGCYSLLAHSEEEEVARDYICFEQPACVIAVCDATALERNLNLVLQIMETTPQVVVCVNLLDEAAKKEISVDLAQLASRLGVPVIGTAARSKTGLDDLIATVKQRHIACWRPQKHAYPEAIEAAIAKLEPELVPYVGHKVSPRWLAIRLLERAAGMSQAMERYLGINLYKIPAIAQALTAAQRDLVLAGYPQEELRDAISESFIRRAEAISQDVVTFHNPHYAQGDRKLDQYFTGPYTGFAIMFLLLLGVFWLTITGSNYPSEILAQILFAGQDWLVDRAIALGVSEAIYGPLLFGVYRVMAWVVSVMLPPMAIFFPLFTLLEDLGYLPRVAYNLDRCFQYCKACGKQALTMCMGFGCNAAGVTGCRIIDSPREQLIAIITNNFVPCNGRFPTIIAMISMFWIGTSGGLLDSLGAAFLLAMVIVIGIIATLVASKLLSMTALKGIPSSFTLELPPFRRPQIGTVIVRSLLDRTLFVLWRAVSVAAPAGLVIWCLANLQYQGVSLVRHMVNALEPLGYLMGLDGTILTAFILGLPANEIILPCMIMIYLAEGALLDIDNLSTLKTLLLDHGWTWLTALCVILFSLMHWPCGTTLLTIQNETKSWRWTMLAVLLPTAMGILTCMAVAAIVRSVGGA